jgi:hypothetical protein
MTMRTLLGVVAAALGLGGWIAAEAQVYAEFQPAVKVGEKPYASLTGATVLDADQFLDPATNNPDRDNGYAVVPLPFLFEFQGYRYSRLAISVNGFVILLRPGETPPLTGGDIPGRLFVNTEPFNVIAPFWGDHYYRTAADVGYVPSQISYKVVGSAPNRAFVVEWKNLNINNKSVPSSVASFQLWLYESSRPGNFQGDIEFAYGLTGSGGPVYVQGAAVGVKGGFGDYLNGLVFTGNVNQARTSTQLTTTWQPSGGSDTVIRFNAIPRLFLEGWGDGDADFSQVGKHSGMGQDRFVTVNDVMVILRSVATDRRLDSLKGRQAYHADVNHNGRFYYSTRNWNNTADTAYHRRAIPTRSLYYWQDLPSDNSLPYVGGDPVLFFEATEYDAAIIMLYMAGRVPYLPWLLDLTVLPPYGRGSAGAGLATNISALPAYPMGPGVYRVALALNGMWEGALGLRVEFQGKILDVEPAAGFEGKLLSSYEGGRLAVSGVLECEAEQPLLYVTLQTQEPVIQVKSVRFNDQEHAGLTLPVALTTGETSLQITPNPAVGRLTASFTVGQAGHYRVALYDVTGKLVRVLSEAEYQPGTYWLEWDGLSAEGQRVGSGLYLCRIEGPAGIRLVQPVVWTQ